MDLEFKKSALEIAFEAYPTDAPMPMIPRIGGPPEKLSMVLSMYTGTGMPFVRYAAAHPDGTGLIVDIGLGYGLIIADEADGPEQPWRGFARDGSLPAPAYGRWIIIRMADGVSHTPAAPL